MLDELLLELVATLDDVLDDFIDEEVATELEALVLTLLVTTIDEILDDDFTLLLRLKELELLAGMLTIDEDLLVTELELVTLIEVAVDEIAIEELATDLMLLVLESFPPPPPHALKLKARAMQKLAQPNCRTLFVMVITGYVSSNVNVV